MLQKIKYQIRRFVRTAFHMKYRSILSILLIVSSSRLYADNNDIHLTYKRATGSSTISYYVPNTEKTWKDLKDSGIEKQDEDFSCGSASAATILHFFYDKDVYEKDILDEIKRITGNNGAASFSDLTMAVKKFGFRTIGLALDFEALKHLNKPVIAYLSYRDMNHFSVIRGVNRQNTVWLGDPSWGNRNFSEKQFKSMWETRDHQTLKGKILMILPENRSLAWTNKIFSNHQK